MKHTAQVTLLVLTGCVVAAVFAAEPRYMTDPQLQTMFEKRRSIESTSHTERIRILREADACVRAAPDYRGFRDCELREQQARQALRDRLRPEVEALRSQWQAFRATYPRE